MCNVFSDVKCNGASLGDPGMPGEVGPSGDDQDCTIQGLPGDPGEVGEPGDPGSDALVTEGLRYKEIQSEIERLKEALMCCSRTDPVRRRRQTRVTGAGGSNSSLSDELVCR